jgi:hypothetical protein
MDKKTEFKQILNSIISAHGNSCSEREMRNTFHKETGENLNVQLRNVSIDSIIVQSGASCFQFQLGGTTLAEFLRTECSEFCHLTYDNYEVRINRTLSEKSQHLDHFTKAGERK